MGGAGSCLFLFFFSSKRQDASSLVCLVALHLAHKLTSVQSEKQQTTELGTDIVTSQKMIHHRLFCTCDKRNKIPTQTRSSRHLKPNEDDSVTGGPAPAKDTLNVAASSKADSPNASMDSIYYSPNASLDSIVVEGISSRSQVPSSSITHVLDRWIFASSSLNLNTNPSPNPNPDLTRTIILTPSLTLTIPGQRGK